METNSKQPIPKRYLNIEDAADYIGGFSVDWFIANAKPFLPAIKPSAQPKPNSPVRYDIVDLDKFMESRKVYPEIVTH